MKEFYDIVDVIKDSLRQSPSINTVTFGNLQDVDLDKTTIFPLAHIYTSDVEHRGNTLVFNISVVAMDIVDISNKETNFDDFYGNDNLHDVLNTQLATLNKLISDLKRGDLYRNQYQLDGTPTLNAFKERFSHVLAGWDVDMRIEVKNNIETC